MDEFKFEIHLFIVYLFVYFQIFANLFTSVTNNFVGWEMSFQFLIIYNFHEYVLSKWLMVYY